MNQKQDNSEKKPFRNYKVIVVMALVLICSFFVGYYVFESRNLEKVDAAGNTPLMEAVKLSDMNRVESLVKRGADINITDSVGDTPLLMALKNNNLQIANFLFERGAELNVQDEDGNTPLLLAIKCEAFDTVKRFINNGAIINLINDKGEHPLTVAIQQEDVDMISLLIDKGADIVVKPLDQMSLGSYVRDTNFTWKFRRGSGYSGRSVKEDYIDWIVIAQEHYGEGKTLLLTREIVAKYVFDPTYPSLGGRDSWHNSRVRMWLTDTFYRSLSDSFKEAIESCETLTGGFAIPDETVFLLSQVELNLGRDNIVGDHGNTIEYFEGPENRTAYFDDTSWYYWTRSAELNIEQDKAGTYYKPRYRVRFVAPGGEVASEYPLMQNGGVRPATNLNSETLVTTYRVDGSHVIVWGSGDLLEPYF